MWSQPRKNSLSFAAKSSELAKSLDEVAKANGVSIMGVGINPGFVMDSLVVYLAAACLEVKVYG